jgi:hypothetical protein
MRSLTDPAYDAVYVPEYTIDARFAERLVPVRTQHRNAESQKKSDHCQILVPTLTAVLNESEGSGWGFWGTQTKTKIPTLPKTKKPAMKKK